MISVILSLAATASALASVPPQSSIAIDQDGVSAVYKKWIDQAGEVHLDGYYRHDGRQFRYVVGKDGDIRGVVGGEIVRFKVPKATG